MSLLGKAMAMFGFGKLDERPYAERDVISRDVSVALQRNERASENARRALEDLRMTDTLRQIAGKMQ